MAKFEALIKEVKTTIKKEGRGDEAVEYPITTVTLVIDHVNTEVNHLVKGHHMVTIAED
ncbi:hypothetical protein PP657_gp034 [Bacillus phage BCPST]|uniref:Uncharacterized protein n=1 Tax=Bacillus phage BCPST TaxID=2801506 RepID=A0AAE7TQB5_9CAUD|nr:hypothetical protein PP657_gp034 [Bacillus phage BCPST]QQO38652.1 hypothetical protein BCPST_034 [Bacillus phage BCPST]QSJ04243.1 hypothetical protein BCP6_038 [Bacillus phage BCP6]